MFHGDLDIYQKEKDMILTNPLMFMMSLEKIAEL